MTASVIEWTVFYHGQWKLYLAKTAKGLCYIGSPGAPYEEMKAFVHKRFPLAELEENAEALAPYVQELNEYFSGTRTSLTLPVDAQGTSFQEEVWQALRQIPYGKTVSYSDIAALIKRPSAVRAVGTAIGANPVLIAVPCHRVIGKSGAITGYRGGLELKSFLLGLEINTPAQ
jgi:methylated-DNA-[protein]-cysteine S-methyltransferase